MESYLTPVIKSILLRVFELQPSVTTEEAITQAISILSKSDIIELSNFQLKSHVSTVARSYTRCGIINPNWLQSMGLKVHFFFINARPGWLEHITTETEQASQGISQYILYGDFDSLIILHGTDAEADKQRNVIENDIYAESFSFNAKSVPLIYRYNPEPIDDKIDWPDAEKLNKIAEDYDIPELVKYRDRLLADKILIGPVWQPMTLRDRIVAFVGVTLRGRHDIPPMDMLRMLQEKKPIERVLVHLFETDTGHPYKYLAKLVCKDQSELDEATNEMDTVKFGQVHVEGTTMIVANGFDQIPLYRKGVVAFPGELPSLADVEVAARDMVKEIGTDAAKRFNDLESSLKLGILSGLARIKEQFERTSIPSEWKSRLREAVLQFGNGALDGAGPGLDGAVTAAMNTVEVAAKRTIRLLAEKVFGLNYNLAQKELKLPTKDFRRLTLGKINNAFNTIRRDQRYKDFWQHLGDERLELFDTFTEERNQWLHGGKQDLSRTRRIHSSADAIVRSIDLTTWLINDFVAPLEKLKITPESSRSCEADSINISGSKGKRNIGFFISHSSKDKDIARRISEAIRAFGFEVFFDEWSIGPSDSIVQKISEALFKHDTLAIILSPNSVKSQWVKKELDSAVMAQLSGHDVKVLPLLVEDCEIPEILRDIRYIDFSKGFEDGFIELIKYIKKRRTE